MIIKVFYAVHRQNNFQIKSPDNFSSLKTELAHVRAHLIPHEFPDSRVLIRSEMRLVRSHHMFVRSAATD